MTPHCYSRITRPIQRLLRSADHIQAHRVAWRAFELAGRLRGSWTRRGCPRAPREWPGCMHNRRATRWGRHSLSHEVRLPCLGTGSSRGPAQADAVGARDRNRPLSRAPGVVFVQIRLTPLLELHHDVGRSSCDGMAARQDRVDAAAAQRQPVLEKDFDIPEAGLDQILC